MSQQQVSQPNQNHQGPTLCLNNCGFFGNPKTENYCSKCHKEVVLRNRPESKQSTDASNANNNNTSNASTPASSAAVPASSPLVSPLPSPAPTPAAAPSLAVPSIVPMLDGKESEQPSGKPEQKKKNRCFSCSKKVGVLGFECRCDYVFCSDHRLPQFHNCTYDMKKHTRDQLLKNNPKVEASKIDKI